MRCCSNFLRIPFLGALTCLLPAAGAQDANGPMSSNRAAEAASAVSAPASQAGFSAVSLFANVCGWCHSGAGRIAGKGPQLMGTALTDAEIVYRVRNGKTGAMPAFKTAFNDEELQAIVKYIRELKPDGAAP
jgi:mono/diheme cytochrome c family protein